MNLIDSYPSKALLVVVTAIPLLGCMCVPSLCKPCDPACSAGQVCERGTNSHCVDAQTTYPACTSMSASPGPGGDPRKVTVYRMTSRRGECFEVGPGTELALPAEWGDTVGSIRMDRGLRAYLCQSSAKDNRCKLVRAGADSAERGTKHVRVEAALWGFADLHTHPAVHLGFGSDDNGNQGIIWGKPAADSGLGLAAARLSIAQDLAACAADKHGGFNADLISHQTRIRVLQAMDKSSCDMEPATWPWPKLVNQDGSCNAPVHSPSASDNPKASGWFTLSDWPHARSITHQQMHVTWLYRAYQGGLRLIVAAAVDNWVLYGLWRSHTGGGGPGLDPTFDQRSATKQLSYIRKLAEANSSWMGIATSPAEARSLVAQDKLAVVLGVEMDKLTADQILSLRPLGLRVVTPVHLVNNDFGGAAVYSDVFNTANWFLNGSHFSVYENADLTFRLECHPKILRWNVDIPDPDSRYPAELYDPCTGSGRPGHKNRMGARPAELRKLMKAGLVIDVAHMSEAAMIGTLELAEQYRYPVINTHSGLRFGKGVSERDMPDALARRMAALGGVLGLPTGFKAGTARWDEWVSMYVGALQVMSGRGVALGTDLNGLAPQTWTNNADTHYPLQAANASNFSHSPTSRPQLSPLLVGGKAYDFKRDGLAHVGLLPELMEAVWKAMGGSTSSVPVLDSMFQSTHDVIDMWEMAERSASAIP